MAEYPFKDLLPLDEVLEREGYYNDWTHLDPEVFYSLTQISEYIKTKGYGVDVRLLIAQLAEHFGLKTTQVIDLANLLQQKFTNLEGVTQSFTSNINSLVSQMEADKNAVIANVTVDSEVILARDGEPALQNRLERDLKVLETTSKDVSGRGINIMYPPSPMIGAKGDGITDDRQAIQNILDSAPAGSKIIFPAPDEFFNIGSTHPDFVGQGLVINKDNLEFEFQGGSYHRSMVKATTEMTALVYIPNIQRGLEFKNMNLDANNLADYAFKGNESYLPYLSMENCHFGKAKIACLALATYVATLTRCLATNGERDGFLIVGPEGGQLTSITMNSCYANTNARYGFNLNFMTYCSMNSCATDNNDVGYYLRNAYGVTLNACGSEKCRKPLHAESYRGLSIVSFYGLNNGSENNLNPDYLMEFGSGENVSISGVSLQSNKNYSKILGLTKSSFGFENITILDDSIKRNEVSFVSNYAFERPIKFVRGDSTNRDITVKITPDELPAHLKSLEGMEINHTYTIELKDGTQSTQPTSWRNTINKISGVGKLIIKGNPSDRSSVRLHGSYQMLRVKDSSVTVELKDLTVDSRVSGGGTGFNLFTADGARKVILSNVVFDTTGFNSESAVYAKNGSEVYVVNGTTTVGSTYLGGTYKKDNTSQIFEN